MRTPIRIGISSCLLGQNVRYDGGHKRDESLIEAFGDLVEWVPVCPEFEMGLGVPREPIHLVRTGAGAVRLVGVERAADHTRAMHDYAKRKLDELAALDLCGYIFKKDSPSCGLRDVPVFDRDGHPDHAAPGMFAAALLERFPDLPVEDEGQLRSAKAREQFLERVLAYARR